MVPVLTSTSTQGTPTTSGGTAPPHEPWLIGPANPMGFLPTAHATPAFGGGAASAAPPVGSRHESSRLEMHRIRQGVPLHPDRRVDIVPPTPGASVPPPPAGAPLSAIKTEVPVPLSKLEKHGDCDVCSYLFSSNL